LSYDRFYVEGRPIPAKGQFPEARLHHVHPGYFRTIGMRLLRGRWFSASDDVRTAVINETMARKFWPGEDPVGRRVHLGRPEEKSGWYTVVGVAGDTKEYGLDNPRVPEIHVPGAAASDFVVRTKGDPLALAPAIRARIRNANKELAVLDVETLERQRSGSVGDYRTLAVLLATFAGLALALAAIGIYGVIAYSVSRRTQEMGIRIALGAGSADVMKLVLRQGMRPVLAGIGLGAAGSYGATRILAGFLFGVKATDPLTFAAVATLMTAVALAACYLPARRATRIEPAAALRYE
jgi:putative ABC transport system permease protein